MFENVANYLIVGGVIVGVIFGLIVRHFDLDMMAAVRGVYREGNHRQLLVFAAALLIAVILTFWLESSGTVEIAKASYRDGKLDWLGAILGGLIFGVGASLGGNDAARLFVNTFGGNLRAALVLAVFVVFATITQFGLLMPLRVWLTNISSVTLVSGDAGLASVFGLPTWLPLLLVAGGLAVYLFLRCRQGAKISLVAVGTGLGLLVAASWYITGVLALDEFNPSHPSGMTASGPMSRIGMSLFAGDALALSYSVSFVIGLSIAGFAYALFTRRLKFEAIPVGTLGASILGGALMGIGATVSYGCNVGQGMTGFSTLSLESLLAVLGMFVGVAVATKRRWE